MVATSRHPYAFNLGSNLNKNLTVSKLIFIKFINIYFIISGLVKNSVRKQFAIFQTGISRAVID